MGARQSAATEKALRAMARGMKQFDAARKYGVYPSTLRRAAAKPSNKILLQNQQVDAVGIDLGQGNEK